MGNSQNRARLEIFLVHPLRLADFQDLSVAQVLQFALELVQGARLGCQRSHNLLLHHLHYLSNKGRPLYSQGSAFLLRKERPSQKLLIPPGAQCDLLDPIMSALS